MEDLKLDNEQADLAWRGGDLVLSQDIETVEQAAWIAFQTWAGDWFMDRRLGVHYNTRVLGKSRSTSRRAEVARVARTIPGVVSIERADFDVDMATREVRADLDLKTVFDSQARRELILDPPTPPGPPVVADGYYVDGQLVPVPDGCWEGGALVGPCDEDMRIGSEEAFFDESPYGVPPPELFFEVSGDPGDMRVSLPYMED